jgi:uncharacterized protein
MRVVFADTSYFIAVANQLDDLHARASNLADLFVGQIITTEWVLTELADAFSKPRWRSAFLATLKIVLADDNVSIVELNHGLFERAVQLFASRPDKSWSLTDCTSFLVMEDHQVTEALTADRHFEQAGFVALLT